MENFGELMNTSMAPNVSLQVCEYILLDPLHVNWDTGPFVKMPVPRFEFANDLSLQFGQ